MTSLGAQEGDEGCHPCPSLRHHPSHRPTRQKQEPSYEAVHWSGHRLPVELGYSGHVGGGRQIRVSCTLQGPAQDLLVIWSQLHGLTGELRIKVVQAIVICDLGLEGRQGLLLFQLRILTRACQMVTWSDGCQHPLPASHLCMYINHRMKQEAQLFNTPGI